MNSSGPAVRLDGVARRFGRRWPLRGVTFAVEPGAVVAIAGPNGSGKTTLLRVVATVLRPTRGGGRVFGHDLVSAADAVRSLVGLLGHSPGLYPDLTAAENLRFARRMWGASATERTVGEALARVGLSADAEERVRSFSAGMQRRLALARLMLRPPRLLLLDEPYASLDEDGVARVNAFLEEVRERGGAALIATHAAARGEGVVDRILRLRAGRVAAVEREAGSKRAPEAATANRTGDGPQARAPA